MPKLTRWFIKSGFICLITALSIGVIIKSQIIQIASFSSAATPVYFHLFMVGWVTQLIFGVSYWTFPRFSRDKPRGSLLLGWSCFWLLNVGLFLRMIGEPLNHTYQNKFGWMLLISAVLQWLAGMFYIFNTWLRIKGD